MIKRPLPLPPIAPSEPNEDIDVDVSDLSVEPPEERLKRTSGLRLSAGRSEAEELGSALVAEQKCRRERRKLWEKNKSCTWPRCHCKLALGARCRFQPE